MKASSEVLEGGPNERAEPIRLQKVLASAGIGSRRRCEELIVARRVRVNGKVARLGDRVDPAADLISVDEALLPIAPDTVHYLVHKPKGVVCSARHQDQRPLVTELVPPEVRVFTVGRLDADSEGLILLTNDGALAGRLGHPSTGIAKEYVATTSRPMPADLVRKLRNGVNLSDGLARAISATLLAPNSIQLVVVEGRNRMVRRMLGHLGYPVVRLIRTRIGPLTLQGLAPGEWRHLDPIELHQLDAATKRLGWSAAGSIL
jgi:23S rRNA pseudouridine2605 synthase